MSQLDLSKLIRMVSKDRDYMLNLGVFRGMGLDATVWKNQAGNRQPVVKLNFTYLSQHTFKEILLKAIGNDKVDSTELSLYSWDRDVKSVKFDGTITVGREDSGEIYFELSSEVHKGPIKFLLGARADMIKINNKPVNAKIASEMTAKHIIDTITTTVAMATCLTSFKYTGEYKGGNSNSSTDKAPDNNPSSTMGDDVPF